MTLSLYFARKFVAAFLVVFGVFLGIMLLIDMVEQLRRFGDQVGFTEALELSALNVPASLYRILPLIVILASIMLFVGLARTSELVISRAAGRSALRSLVAPVMAALTIGAISVAILNPIVAATSKRYEALSSRYARQGENIMSISREGLWLRQGNTDGQTVIRAARANLDGTQLFDTTFLSFSADAGPVQRIEAAEANLVRGAWQLTDAKVWPLGDAANPEADATRAASLDVATDLTADQIRDSFGTPSAIPIWELPAFIDGLERAGFSARQHRVWFQSELALPLLLAAMVLVGAGFTMRHARFGRTGLMVLMALIAGFAIFFLRNFAQLLGENGQIPVLLAVWSPPVIALLFSLTLLLHLEDG